MIYKSIKLDWLGHSGFKINGSRAVVYLDPFKIYQNHDFEDDGLGFDDETSPGEIEKADIIFITHSHFDHCSIEDIQKIAKDGTIIVCSPDCQSKFSHIKKRIEIKTLETGDQLEFEDRNIRVWAVPAYNVGKTFHSKEEDWNGYIIQIDDVKVYHAGDTDFIPEMKNVASMSVDFALLPIGGTFTMNAGEAAKAACVIKPKFAVPMHYDFVSGSGNQIGAKSDADIFAKFCSKEGIEVKMLEKIS